PVASRIRDAAGRVGEGDRAAADDPRELSRAPHHLTVEGRGSKPTKCRAGAPADAELDARARPPANLVGAERALAAEPGRRHEDAGAEAVAVEEREHALRQAARLAVERQQQRPSRQRPTISLPAEPVRGRDPVIAAPGEGLELRAQA